MADLGQAFVQIVPSAEGITNKMTGVLEPGINKAGEVGGSKLSEALGKGLQSAGTNMTKYVTGPIAGIGAAATAAWKEVDVGLDTIVQKTGASGDALDDMKSAMEGIAASIPTDFATAGEAVGEVNTRFGLTGDALEDLAGQFVQFAQLNNTDVSSSIDNTQKALAAFGLDASDAGALLDRLNSVGQATGASVDTLTQGLVQNGTAFQEMGMSIDQAAVFMGQLETSGANSETVMNALRKAMKNATADGTPLNEALANLQDTILNGTDSMDGLTAAYDIFGKSGDQIYGAIKNGTLDFTNLTAAVEDCGDSVATTFEGTLDGPDKLKTTLNELKITGSELASNLMEALQPAMEKISEVVSNLSEKWKALSPETQDAIIKAALIAAAIGPVIVAITQVISVVSTIKTAISAVSGALSALSAGPMLLIVAGIAAVIAAGVLLYQHWDEVCEWANNLKEKVVEAWNNLKENVENAVNTLKENVSQKWENLKTKVSTTAENIKSTVSEKWNTAKEKVGSIMETMRGNVQTKLDAIKTAYEQNGGGIKGIVAGALEAVHQNFKTKYDVINKLTGGRLDDVKKAFEEKLNAAKGTVETIFGNIKSAIETKINNARDAVKGAIDKIKGFFNFEWSLPKLKLPHFSITGKFSLDPPSVPHLNVEWYAKGGIFDSPSIIGIGEAGPEAVIPLSGSNVRPFARAVADEMRGGDNSVALQMLALMQMYFPQMANMQVVTDTGALVGAIAPQMDRELGNLQKQRGRMR